MLACVKTPIGFLEIFFDQSFAVKKISLVRPKEIFIPIAVSEFIEQLIAYFEGKLLEFNYPINIQGLSNFDKKVLDLTRKIPYGHTVTYKLMAEKINTSPRAIGQALRRNPIPIIIPCHRVIKSDGTQGGYSLGIEVKKWLIEHERSVSLVKSYQEML